jgi:hypothetical protein
MHFIFRQKKTTKTFFKFDFLSIIKGYKRKFDLSLVHVISLKKELENKFAEKK